MKLNFFFDLDGTLIPHGEGPNQSAVEAVVKAHEEGHRIFLCTGRSPAETPDSLKVLPIDGGVFSAGATVVFHGEEKYRSRFSDEQRSFIWDYAEKLGLLPMVQADSGTYMTEEAFDFFNESLIRNIGKTIDVPNLVVVDEISKDLPMIKFLCLSKEGRIPQVKKDLKGVFDVVDNTLGIGYDYMAEVVLKGITKATGIERILEALGEEKASTVGIGDGANDMEMVEFCGLGVAMGNASPELKAIADFITTDVRGDGIKDALEYAVEKYLPSID